MNRIAVCLVALFAFASIARADETTIKAERALACQTTVELGRIRELAQSGDKDATALQITRAENAGRCKWLVQGDRIFVDRDTFYGYMRIHLPGDPMPLHIWIDETTAKR